MAEGFSAEEFVRRENLTIKEIEQLKNILAEYLEINVSVGLKKDQLVQVIWQNFKLLDTISTIGETEESLKGNQSKEIELAKIKLERKKIRFECEKMKSAERDRQREHELNLQKAAIICARFFFGLHFFYTNPLPISSDILKTNPYNVKLCRKLIDGCAFGMYGHWVKRGHNQNRAALFEHTLRDDWKNTILTASDAQ